ncbi:MAG: Ig-like domain-containing protein, partial [Gemmatimonadales bacterium]
MRLGPAGVVLPVILLAGCARIEPPPGGPPDFTAPVLISTTPDSLAVLPGFDDDVEFQFNEVISEGSTPSQGLGTSDLERVILLSPTTSVPEVRWKRDRLVVHPREGWQADRVYRIQLLPGIRDLRRNRLDSGTVVTFTTGAPLPDAVLTGTVVDWVAAAPARGALVEAVLQPDSLVYRVLADSAGDFRLGPVPAGQYVVYGIIDQNNNRQRDARESFDSASVELDTTAATRLWTFPHDTTGPRATAVQASDSMTITVTMSAPLDPAQR